MISIHSSEFSCGHACEEGLLPHRPLLHSTDSDPTCNGLLEMNPVPSGLAT